jgi:hypothetical protein
MVKHSGHGHKTETPDVSHIRNVEVTHEASDISVNGVLTFVVALTILTVAVYVGMLLLFNTFQSQSQAEPKPGPMALKQEQRLPPEPRLQAAPGFPLRSPMAIRLISRKHHKPSIRPCLKNGTRI